MTTKEVEDIISEITKVDAADEVEDGGETQELNTARVRCGDNVVDNRRYKEVQLDTMATLSKYLANTYGPMGSYSEIILGDSQDTVHSKYSKDGLTVLKHIYFNQPIEATIRDEVEEICRYVETKVGDGTTSAVILANYIFRELHKIEKKFHVMPRTIIEIFKSHVEWCQTWIRENKRECTLDDIYKICMISTNGNKEISENIAKIYEEHGLNVDIEVSISNDTDNKLKEYDGITIDEGFSDPSYRNSMTSNTCEVHNAQVYYFADPADDMTMISLFEKILLDNVLAPVSNGQPSVPTVILVPKLSRDSSAMLNQVVNMLNQYDARKMYSQKPQILVITNYVGADEGIAFDIARLCGCNEIKKYINPEHEKADRESGIAPTAENIHTFAGSAELVVADSQRTKFINPKTMIENPDIYAGLVQFLEQELERCEKENEDPYTTGRIKNRLRRLRTNNVEYFIGGIAVSDRDALRDLVIDAVKNCRSAAEFGVGRAANYEGMEAALTRYHCTLTDQFREHSLLEQEIAKCILKAYYNASVILYSTIVDEGTAYDLVNQSIRNREPFDLSDIVSMDCKNLKDVAGGNVLCSIKTDIIVLDAISKIVTIMVTSNQCLLPNTDLNRY